MYRNSVRIESEEINAVANFSLLGSAITVKRLAVKKYSAGVTMIFRCSDVSITIEINTMQVMIFPMMFYGTENWT